LIDARNNSSNYIPQDNYSDSLLLAQDPKVWRSRTINPINIQTKTPAFIIGELFGDMILWPAINQAKSVGAPIYQAIRYCGTNIDSWLGQTLNIFPTALASKVENGEKDFFDLDPSAVIETEETKCEIQEREPDHFSLSHLFSRITNLMNGMYSNSIQDNIEEPTCKVYGVQKLPSKTIKKLNDPNTQSIYEVFPDMFKISLNHHGAFPVYVSKKSGIIAKQLTQYPEKIEKTMLNAQKLKDTGVIPTHHGVFNINGELFLLAEYVEGETIKDKYASLYSPLKYFIFNFDIDSFQIDFMAKLLVALQPIADKKICMGDDHGGNMIETPDGRIIFIDLDYWGECETDGARYEYHSTLKHNFRNNMFLNSPLGTDLKERRNGLKKFPFRCKDKEYFIGRDLVTFIDHFAKLEPGIQVEEIERLLNEICKHGMESLPQ
jgi:hypothetical protein